MTPFWWGVVVGAILGANLAFVLMGLCACSRKEEP